jgi:hypothetical protein
VLITKEVSANLTLPEREVFKEAKGKPLKRLYSCFSSYPALKRWAIGEVKTIVHHSMAAMEWPPWNGRRGTVGNGDNLSLEPFSTVFTLLILRTSRYQSKWASMF